MTDDKALQVSQSVEGSFSGVIIAIVLAVFLFNGEPDIATSARIWIGKAAGTIPVDYVYLVEEEQ